jgi:acyl-CoA reductase-like NAD-dependent aldehyde dehydrogenase
MGNFEPFDLGNEVSMAESFGPALGVMRMASNDEERDRVLNSFSHRARIFSKNASSIQDMSAKVYNDSHILEAKSTLSL